MKIQWICICLSQMSQCRLRILSSIFPIILTLCLSVPCFAKEVPILSFIDKEEMIGHYYPVFQIDIYANGGIEYQGIKYVKKLGKHHANITPSQVQELVAAFKAHSARLSKHGDLHDLVGDYKSDNKVLFHWHGKTEEINYDDSIIDDYLRQLNTMIDISDWHSWMVNGTECSLSEQNARLCSYPKDAELCPPLVPSKPSVAKKIAHQTPVLIFCEYGEPNAPLQPNYQIDLYEDGGVYYRGVNDVRVLGDRHAKITTAQVQKMISLYQKIFDPDKSEIGKYAAIPHGFESIQFHYQGVSRKSYPGTYRIVLLTELNEMSNIKQWLCYPKQRNDCPIDKSISNNLMQNY